MESIITSTSSRISYLPEYLALLEKTNQQLSLWTNPYGFMVGVLTFLVAVLAIVFSIMFVRQSADYKKSFAESMESFFAQQAQLMNARFEAEIEALKAELKDTTVSDREKLEERIKKLEVARQVYQAGGGGGSGFTGYAELNRGNYPTWKSAANGGSWTDGSWAVINQPSYADMIAREMHTIDTRSDIQKKLDAILKRLAHLEEENEKVPEGHKGQGSEERKTVG